MRTTTNHHTSAGETLAVATQFLAGCRCISLKVVVESEISEDEEVWFLTPEQAKNLHDTLTESLQELAGEAVAR